MRQDLTWLIVALSFLLLNVAATNAAIITNGSLTVEINDDNGAIDQLLFGGSDWYNPGVPVSDFGMQVGALTSSFRRNTTTGNEGINITFVSSGPTITATGVYNAAGVSVDVTRQYSLLAGQNVLRVATTLTNRGPTTVNNLRLFDTADPDPVVAASGGITRNDRTLLAGGTVLESEAFPANAPIPLRLTTIWGFAPTGGYAFGIGGLGVLSGDDLNTLFNTGGNDPDRAAQDIGMALGEEFTLASGETATTSYFQAYGLTRADARDAFAAAVAIPEASSMLVWWVLTAGVFASRTPRRREPAVKIRKSIPPHTVLTTKC